jgi:Glutathione S-transferase, N-terminal domain
MKLYYAPGACSLADHIALLDVGQRLEIGAVDMRTKRTESGADFHDINPKGYVPALVLDSGETITENIAVLDWIAEQYPVLRPKGELSRTRLLEMLTFISTEIHRACKPLWHSGGEPEKQKARALETTLLGIFPDLTSVFIRCGTVDERADPQQCDGRGLSRKLHAVAPSEFRSNVSSKTTPRPAARSRGSYGSVSD